MTIAEAAAAATTTTIAATTLSSSPTMLPLTPLSKQLPEMPLTPTLSVSAVAFIYTARTYRLTEYRWWLPKLRCIVVPIPDVPAAARWPSRRCAASCRRPACRWPSRVLDCRAILLMTA